MLSDRQLRDYVEGALLPAQASELERLLADIPGSLRDVIAQQTIDQALRVAFGDASDEKRIKESILAIIRETPMPEAKSKMPRVAAPRVRSAGQVRKAQARPAKRPRPAVLAGIAIAAGIFIFWMMHQLGYIARIDTAGSGNEVVRGGKTGRAGAGLLLRKEDILRVAESATVEYPDATLLMLGPSSSAAFGKPVPGKCDKCIRVLAGSLNAVVRPSEPAMMLSSEHIVASISKGELKLDVDSTRTRVEVTAGTLHIERPGDNRTVEVKAGEFVEAAADGDLEARPLGSAPSQPAEPAQAME